MLKGNDLLSIHNLTCEEVEEILNLAKELKRKQKEGIAHELLKGKTLGMIFEKSSTRTRVSFEVGMYQLGGHALFLSAKDLQLGRGEPIKDTARVLSRYLDGIMIRTFEQEKIEELADYASIPVINGLTDLLHPCQVLTDLFTIREFKKTSFNTLKMAYVGDGNNMAHSYIFGAAKVGLKLNVATPKEYKPNQEIVSQALKDSQISGAQINIMDDPIEAVQKADIISTDTWASMGQESEHDERKKIFTPYQVNAELLKHAKDDVMILHCLPAYRGEEITEDIFERHAQEIFEEAENRLHVQKAILALTLAN